MFELNTKRILVIVAVISFFIFYALAQKPVSPPPTPNPSPTPTPTPTCKGEGCFGISRAEEFLNGFGTAGNSKGMRTSELEMEEEVRNAFYGIDATRIEVEKGRLTQAEGDFIIDGHVQVIRNYVNATEDEAWVLSYNGQASDLPALRKPMGRLLSIARQDQLMGREKLAMEAQARMIRALKTFSQRFAETCEEQNFEVTIAAGIERQNEMFGTGISVEHCMKRMASVEFNSQGVKYSFESCSNMLDIDPWQLDRKWKLKISGLVNGEGNAHVNLWEAKVNFKGSREEPSSEMELNVEEVEVKEDSIQAPNDAGPNAKPNGWTSAPVPEKAKKPKIEKIMKMRIKTILMTGNRGYACCIGPWVENEVKVGEKPCKE